jgi:hypothetical protein
MPSIHIVKAPRVVHRCRNAECPLAEMTTSMPLHVMIRLGSGELQTYERAVNLGDDARSTTRRSATTAAVASDAVLMSRTRIHFETEGRGKERYGSAAEFSAMDVDTVHGSVETFR